jgi:hypothetical protein
MRKRAVRSSVIWYDMRTSFGVTGKYRKQPGSDDVSRTRFETHTAWIDVRNLIVWGRLLGVVLWVFCVVLCIFCVVLCIFVLFFVLFCFMYFYVVLCIFVLFYVCLCCSMYLLWCSIYIICVVLCIVCFVLFSVLFVCKCAVKYIISYIITYITKQRAAWNSTCLKVSHQGVCLNVHCAR